MGHAAKVDDDPALKRVRTTCPWARFEAERPRAAYLIQHAKSKHHSLALKHFLDPTVGLSLPGSAAAPEVGSLPVISGRPRVGWKGITKACPFGTGVPQPADYHRVWQNIVKHHSGRSTAATHAGERYRHDPDPRLEDGDQIDAVQRELKQVSFVFAEVIRQDDRKFLRRATECTLCCDASSSKNVMQFVASSASDDVVETRSGLIGILSEVGSTGSSGVSVEDPSNPNWPWLVEDVRRKKSLKSKEGIMKCLSEFHSEGCIDKHNPGKLVLSDYNYHREIIGQTAFDGPGP